jgi:imidazole glycerol phosphate synthase subunit HisF
LEVASEYFRSGADKISIGSDAVYTAEEYLRTGVCFPLFNSLSDPCTYACMPMHEFVRVSLLIIIDYLLFQVKTGKSSLELISRIYGHQVLQVLL